MVRRDIMKIKQSIGERAFHIFNYIFISLCGFLALYPFLQVIATSFSSSRAVSSGEVIWRPVEFNLLAYKQLLEDGQIFVAMKNTVILTVIGTTLNMLATILAAYSLSKKRLRGRGIFLLIIIFTMMFNGGMIPNFILIKKLGLMDNYLGLWLMGLIGTYNMFVMKTFFENMPESLEEAAAIDGANDIQIMIKLILPLSLPVIATLTLFYAVGWWNQYFNAMLYITSTSKQPLMVKLMQMLDTAQMIMVNTANPTGGTEGVVESTIAPETFKAASIIISTLPILCVYPFLQKYFVKGVMIGSIKG
jgi:putative aldouronate transport system permease protein